MVNSAGARTAALWLGVGGLGAGVAGFALDAPGLALTAGALALSGGLVSMWTSREPDTERALVRRVAELEAALEELQNPMGEPIEPDDPDDVTDDDAVAAAATMLSDDETGLFNEQFFRVTLEARVSAARRHLRPVAVVLLEVAEGVRAGEPRDVAPMVVAAGIGATLRDADTACRLDDGRFALILEDTPENGAVWTVERVRRALVADHPEQTLWAGVACYPAHAFDAWELFDRASQALTAAKEWRQDRIEVATGTD